jgi:acetyl-CoA synthetase
MSVASAERDLLRGRLASGLNAAIECCDRWAEDNRIVLEWVGRDMQRETVTYASLKADSERFANLLRRRGIGKGDIVAGLLPRIPELLAVVIGTWRAGAVYQPLFTAFGPKAIEARIFGDGGSGAKLVITDGQTPQSSPMCRTAHRSSKSTGRARSLDASHACSRVSRPNSHL